MKKKIAQSIIIALLMLLTALTTCTAVKTGETKESNLPGKILLKQLEQQKQEKENIIKQYTAKLNALTMSNDSLQKQVYDKKQLLTDARLTVKAFENSLKQQLNKADSCGQLPGTIIPLFDSLSIVNEQNNKACDETIEALENKVANRDSSIVLHQGIETSLKDIQRDQELKNQELTEQLNAACKSQRKKARQNKFLAGGLLILSGIASSLLITHNLK